MGRIFETIDARLSEWLTSQPLFFVATAPTGADGHVNLSPKGGAGLFRVLGPNQVAYLDLIGSGAETIAHLRENGRIVLMFCAFDRAPKIIRLHGLGRVTDRSEPEYGALRDMFAPSTEISLIARSIITIDVTRIADSCGFVVPHMELVAERDQLVRWAENQEAHRGANWKDKYIESNNLTSIDGLPALDARDSITPRERTMFSSEGRAL